LEGLLSRKGDRFDPVAPAFEVARAVRLRSDPDAPVVREARRYCREQLQVPSGRCHEMKPAFSSRSHA
jgi:hypothetical protein